MDKKLELQNRLTVNTDPALFGCNPLFEICGDGDLMSLSFASSQPFLDWIGWERTQLCRVLKNFITFVRADKNLQGTGSNGWLSDPCGDPNGVEVDICDFELEDFGRLRRAGPVRDITKTEIKYCVNQPRYRLDGSPITDQREYDMRVATEVLIQDLCRLIIEGNSSTGGQFDGFEQLIKTGYTDSQGRECPLMDSIIVDWDGQLLDASNGATWNGDEIPDGTSFIDVLLQAYRVIKHRIAMSPALSVQQMRVGDMVLLLPHSFIPCILDLFTCWSVCDENITINSLEARRFRDGLNGGLYGSGRIFLEGFEIPIMPFDFGLISSINIFDAYLLTGAVGNVKIIQGQYNDMAPVAQKRSDRYATDGGRLLTWSEDDQTCEKQIVEIQPRIFSWAPWAQARFEDLACNMPGGVFSDDPWDQYFPYNVEDRPT